MSSEPADSDQADSPIESTDSVPDAQPLTIKLPDGSESVSDAILAHREMLHAPEEHGLATSEDITHLSEGMETLSTELSETGQAHEETQAEVEQLRATVERQREQIDELQSAVTSLAEILGTTTEWETFDDGTAEDENAEAHDADAEVAAEADDRRAGRPRTPTLTPVLRRTQSLL